MNSRFISIFYFLVLLTFTGCDIFDTRDAEIPEQPRSNFQQPVEASFVINNLINSLSDKNVENYLACFSDSNFSGKTFIFSASGGAISQFPALADMWDKKNEEQYFNNLKIKVAENAQITLSLSNENFSPQGDSLIYTASYSLNVPHNDSSIPTNYQGELSFSMIRDSRSLWSIYYWIDTKSGDLPSWSELKGRLFY